MNFKSVYDADVLVNLEERQRDKDMGRETLMAAIEESFLTESGKALAKKHLLVSAP